MWSKNYEISRFQFFPLTYYFRNSVHHPKQCFSRCPESSHYSYNQCYAHWQRECSGQWHSTPAAWSGDPKFKSWPSHRLSCLRFCVVFLSFSRQTSKQHIKLTHYRILAHHLQLIVAYPIIRVDIVLRSWQKVSVKFQDIKQKLNN
jgi:hypothetical protein